MTGATETTIHAGVHGNLAISRKIHKQLVNKKNRWKPSELELAVLKLHFQKNKYPTKEDKEEIIKSLEENFDTKIDINQLSRWFQHEREKFLRQTSKTSKNTYIKFGKGDLEYLQEKFQENNYPKIEEMKMMAQRLEVSLSKVENWYKHNRRSLAKRGHFHLKTKKYFKRNELAYLMEMFELYPRPNKDQILEIAERLDCNEIQIKNWYSNKRKKLKSLAKKKGTTFGEDVLHKTDFPSFSKPLVSLPDFDSNHLFGVQPEHNTLPLNPIFSTTTTTTPSFNPNMTLPTFQNPVIYPPNTAIPLLIIPAAAMNQSSPMILNLGGQTLFGNMQQQQEVLPELKPSRNGSDPEKKIKTQSFNYPNPLVSNAFVPISAFSDQNSWLPNNPTNFAGIPNLGAGGGQQPQLPQQPVYNNPPQPNLIPIIPTIYPNQTDNQINPATAGGFVGNGNQPTRIQYLSNVYLPPGANNNIFLNPYTQNAQNFMFGGQQQNNQFVMNNNQMQNNVIIHPPPVNDFERANLTMNMNMSQNNFEGLKSCN